jgi:ABC-2 type transport system ATP-binding protein
MGYPSTISFRGVHRLPDGLAGISRVLHDNGRTTLETRSLQDSLTELMLWAARNDLQLDALDARSPSLESVFLSIADGRVPDTQGSLR